MRAEYLVETENAGIRLDKYVCVLLSGVPHSLIEKLLRKGEILLNGVKAKASSRIAMGDVLSIKDVERIVLPKRGEPTALYCESLLSSIRASIIYEDENVVAIHKPAGVSVQGGSGISLSISDLLDKLVQGEQLRIVHRLDKDTSGVLVLARTLEVARCLAQKFRNREIEKEYIAVTSGVPSTASGVVKTGIFYRKKVGGIEEKVEKEAETFFSVISSTDKSAVVLLRPVTGRKHQLRIHMSQIGCPIIGDKKYDPNYSKGRKLHLHASLMTFNLSDRKVRIIAPTPNYMEDAMQGILDT